MKVAVVLARQKPLAEQPEWAVCCDAVRAIYKAQEAAGVEMEAVPSTAFVGEVECRYCGRITSDVKYVRQISHTNMHGEKGAIPIEGFEFDEKPVRFIDSRRLG